MIYTSNIGIFPNRPPRMCANRVSHDWYTTITVMFISFLMCISVIQLEHDNIIFDFMKNRR